MQTIESTVFEKENVDARLDIVVAASVLVVSLFGMHPSSIEHP